MQKKSYLSINYFRPLIKISKQPIDSFIIFLYLMLYKARIDEVLPKWLNCTVYSTNCTTILSTVQFVLYLE